MSKDNGGPAFPSGSVRKSRPAHDPGASWVETDIVSPISGGMTLRDYFAAKAMQGMSSRGGYSEWAHMAEDAYEMADAMLEARK